MNILLLGYGKEGKSMEAYLKKHFDNPNIEILENFTPAELQERDYSPYDMIFRSPSVPPLRLPEESSMTKYFFDHCPCPIIGVTATKGKGTTCSFIKALLDAEGADAYLVGNIGSPAIDILDDLTENSIVVYEMSSFQLWDLKKSPHIAVLGTLEPDHLNVHTDYADYLDAKSHITSFQTEADYLVYFQNNSETVRIAKSSKAALIPYPFKIPESVKKAITLPGQHNQDNAIAAISAVACYKKISPDEYLREHETTIIKGLSSFHGLPHRLEFLREFDGIKIYDDNFATNPSSTRVAINSFPDSDLTIIIGGRDKTNYEDLPELYEILQAPWIKHIVLLGESGHELANRYKDPRFTLTESLEQAVHTALNLAHQNVDENSDSIVLMSPAAASFDMFKDVYDRGSQFKLLTNNL